MKHLEGIRSFKTNVWQELAGLYAQLTSGQKPFAFVIACSDSRYHAELVMQTRPGDLFVLRNAGNMILPYNGGQHPSESAATLEYAVKVLGIDHVVVLGHYGCGLVESALARPQCLCGLKSLKTWVDQTAHEQVEKWDECDEHKRREIARAACRAHVLHQLENLRTHPCVSESKTVQLHGLIFDMATGVVDEFDADTGTFVPVETDRTDEKNVPASALPACAIAKSAALARSASSARSAVSAKPAASAKPASSAKPAASAKPGSVAQPGPVAQPGSASNAARRAKPAAAKPSASSNATRATSPKNPQ